MKSLLLRERVGTVYFSKDIYFKAQRNNMTIRTYPWTFRQPSLSWTTTPGSFYAGSRMQYDPEVNIVLKQEG